MLEIYDTLRSVHIPAACYAVGKMEGESAGFSVFGDCSVNLQREGFVSLSDTAFVQTHECLHAQIQDQSTSEFVFCRR